MFGFVVGLIAFLFAWAILGRIFGAILALLLAIPSALLNDEYSQTPKQMACAGYLIGCAIAVYPCYVFAVEVVERLAK